MKPTRTVVYISILQSFWVHTLCSYITREIDGKLRYCIPYVNCPPGNEIHVCKENYSKDTCEPCYNKTYIQPEHISSVGNTEMTRCFIPKSACTAHDVIHSRIETTKNCDFARFCKCNKNECYYGDSCTCAHRHTPCKAGETMNDQGGCEKCPYGTVKPVAGCGPCTYVQQGQSTNTDRTSTAVTHTRHGNVSKLKRTDRIDVQEIAEPMTNRINITNVSPVTGQQEHSDPDLMIAIIVVLSVFVMLGIFVVILLMKRNKRTDILNPENGPLVEQIQNHQREITNEHQHADQVINADPINNKNNISNCKNNLINQNLKSNNTRMESKISEMDISKSIASENALSLEETLPTLLTKLFDNNEKELSSGKKDSLKRIEKVENEWNPVEEKLDTNKLSLDDMIPDVRSKDTYYHVIHNSVNSRLNAESLKTCNNSGKIQMTEKQLHPVAQPTDTCIGEQIIQHRGQLTSGYLTQEESFPLNSPMSMTENNKTGQEYQHLVSVSERNTESLISNLECYNHKLTGENNLSSFTGNTDSLTSHEKGLAEITYSVN